MQLSSCWTYLIWHLRLAKIAKLRWHSYSRVVQDGGKATSAMGKHRIEDGTDESDLHKGRILPEEQKGEWRVLLTENTSAKVKNWQIQDILVEQKRWGSQNVQQFLDTRKFRCLADLQSINVIFLKATQRGALRGLWMQSNYQKLAKINDTYK